MEIFMQNRKKSFIMYNDWYSIISGFSDEKKAKLLDAVFKYNIYSTESALDPELEIAFAFMKQAFDRDNKKWLETREKRSAAGKISAEKRKYASSDDNTSISY